MCRGQIHKHTAVRKNMDDQFLTLTTKLFKRQKSLADRALAQLISEELHVSLMPESNCAAIIMKHMAGNMHSRWTDFLTSDGEKPIRNRDSEFIDDLDDSKLQSYWEAGWQVLFDTLAKLTAADLSKTVTIRGEAHLVVEAILRQLDHYAQHVGQLIFIAKALRGENWQTLSIAKGRSEAYNQQRPP
jgi:hypothetical protein